LLIGGAIVFERFCRRFLICNGGLRRPVKDLTMSDFDLGCFGVLAVLALVLLYRANWLM
jgi:hypothetical protein